MADSRHQPEVDEIRARYERRATSGVSRLYDPMLNVNLSIRHERERALVRMLRRWLGPRALGDQKILEVGCGGGGNLLELLTLGADPSKITANELLPARMAIARHRLPSSVEFVEGDATASGIAAESLDLVAQMVVFSSILDMDMRRGLAREMWTWLRPGGAVLWYDFVFNNPRNADVRAVGMGELRELFPQGVFDVERVTLAPPLARAASRVHPGLYGVLNLVPLLRTHVIALIRKP